MYLCTYVKLFTTVPYRRQCERRNFKPRIFGNFCRKFLRLLAHSVATITKCRQFLDSLCSVAQWEFSAGITLPFIGDAFVF